MTLITGLFAPQEGKSVPFQLKERSFAFFNVKTANKGGGGPRGARAK